MSTESGRRAEFENVFKEREDPWRYTSPYEQTKYERTLALIPEGVEAALEIGCAEGHFTVQLARRVKALTACDIAETAVQRAAARCAMVPNIRFARLDLVSEPLPGPVDLIVCSEMLYYVGSTDRLRKVAKKIGQVLKRNGYLVMAHMNLLVDDPHQTGFDFQLPFGARVIGDVFRGSSHFRLLKEIRTPLYRIHLFQRMPLLQRWLIRSKSETIFLRDEQINLEPDVVGHVKWMS